MSKQVEIDGKKYEVISSCLKHSGEDSVQFTIAVPGVKDSGELRILREVKNEPMPRIQPGDALFIDGDRLDRFMAIYFDGELWACRNRKNEFQDVHPNRVTMIKRCRDVVWEIAK